jgi:hypothetical protein
MIIAIILNILALVLVAGVVYIIADSLFPEVRK